MSWKNREHRLLGEHLLLKRTHCILQHCQDNVNNLGERFGLESILNSPRRRSAKYLDTIVRWHHSESSTDIHEFLPPSLVEKCAVTRADSRFPLILSKSRGKFSPAAGAVPGGVGDSMGELKGMS